MTDAEPPPPPPPPPPRCLLAIDVETTGPSLIMHRMVALGACLVEVGQEPRVLARFRAFLPLPELGSAQWERRCFDEFWNKPLPENAGATPLAALRALVAADTLGVEKPHDAMRRFWDWALCAVHGRAVTVVSDTAGFDYAWVQFYLQAQLDTPGKSHALDYVTGEYQPMRCITSHVLGAAGRVPWLNSKGARDVVLQDTLGRADLPAVCGRAAHDHDPANDAENMATRAAYVYYALLQNADAANKRARRAEDDSGGVVK